MRMETRAVLTLAFVLTASTPSRAQRYYDYFPEIEPFRAGLLKVSGRHEIYYELSGDPLGQSVMVLHGGPGGGSYPSLRRYHDPKRYQIILFDQRGAGKSQPKSETRENTTDDLVEDMEKLRKELDIDKMQLFGGSWGSTLALAYAEKYPQHVDSMVLRGVFLATKKEIDHFYHGGTGQFFPDAYEKLKAVLPSPERLNYPEQLLKLLQTGDEATRQKVGRAWAAFETKTAALETSDEEVESLLNQSDCYNFSLLENHYMANGCFIPEGSLLKNAHKLAGIPTVIVHGRYDVICVPQTAYELHKAIPGSRLVIVESAGHSGGALLMRSALIDAVASLDRQKKKAAAK